MKPFEMEPAQTAKARVFVSCGQRDEEEKRIAFLVEQGLESLGFEPYVGIHKQSTGSLMKNILNVLRQCEYYLFIDFLREQLVPSCGVNRSSNSKHRGSLFSNQELAIATYLEKPIIAFQERSVKTRDGILGAIQANVIQFDNRKILVRQVLKKVKRDWISNWRNEIEFYDSARNHITPEAILRYGPTKLPAWFYHISIKNLHKYESAQNCIAYLESYEVFSGKSRQPHKVTLQPVELKWEGMKTRSVLVPPNIVRKIDALYVFESNPQLVHVGINPFLVDSSSLLKHLEGANEFHLTFVVYSDNFLPIRSKYILKMGLTIEHIKFYKK